jgi:hypothetical protein
MVVPGRDRHDATRKTGHVDSGVSVGRRAIAELTKDVQTPALDTPAGRESAREILPCGNRGNSRREPLDIDRRVSVGRRSVAELPVGVETPTFHAPRAGENTCVIAAS